jgi:hypothetical protein
MFLQTCTSRNDRPQSFWDGQTIAKTSQSARATVFDCAFRTILICSWEDFFNVRAATPCWGSAGLNNTGVVVSFNLFPVFSPVQVSSREICKGRLSRVITLCERLPDSYNKFLVQGSAKYSSRILSRIDENQDRNKKLFGDIRRFATDLESLCRQYVRDFASTFALLDFALIEDRFELIQTKATRLGLLPRLEDIPVAELLRD